uniref:Uncharacterized protein n=1 Tax=Amphimedon queenslandica TaxID=400682 RepID=A0A1X7UM13_AMPQE
MDNNRPRALTKTVNRYCCFKSQFQFLGSIWVSLKNPPVPCLSILLVCMGQKTDETTRANTPKIKCRA